MLTYVMIKIKYENIFKIIISKVHLYTNTSTKLLFMNIRTNNKINKCKNCSRILLLLNHVQSFKLLQ